MKSPVHNNYLPVLLHDKAWNAAVCDQRGRIALTANKHFQSVDFTGVGGNAFKVLQSTTLTRNIAQIFCFDIAAMTFSCRGRGLHPRFLLHDSPREADMGEAPYGRIFDHIIEQATAKPNFHHIITTTTNPPEEYQEPPYLRLKLDSTTSAGKLFKRDL